MSDLVQKYREKGRLYLSVGLIQRILNAYAEENYPNDTDIVPEEPAVFQVLGCIPFKMDEHAPGTFARMELSDGGHSYKYVFMHNECEHKAERHSLHRMEKGTLLKPVIALNVFRIYARLLKKGDRGAKTPILIVKDYDLLNGPVAIMGAPKKHSGDVKEHQNDIIDKDSCDASISWSGPPGETSSSPAKLNSPLKIPAASSCLRGLGGSLMGVGTPQRLSSCTPISSISPYNTKYRICGMISAKEEMRTVKTKQGDTKVFNFEMTDKSGTTIRAAAFGDCADRFYGLLHLNEVYFLSNAGVRPANKRFNTTGHDYELSLNNNTEVTPNREECWTAPKVMFRIKAVPLKDLAQHENENVDVLACIESVGEANEFTSRDGKEFVKRELTLIDQTLTQVVFTMWGEQAKKFEPDVKGQAIAVKGALVKSFNGGLSLSGGGGTKWSLCPDMPEVAQLLQWYEEERPGKQTLTLSNSSPSENMVNQFRFIGAATLLELGKDEAAGSYFYVRASINLIKTENAMYQACPSPLCNKKVVPIEDLYRCEKCNKETKDFKFVYNLQAEIHDFTGMIWVGMFNKQAEELLGKTAEEANKMKEDDASEYDALFNNVLLVPRFFRLRAKAETYNEEVRIKYTVINCQEMHWEKYGVLLDIASQKLKQLHV